MNIELILFSYFRLQIIVLLSVVNPNFLEVHVVGQMVIRVSPDNYRSIRPVSGTKLKVEQIYC